MRAKGGGKFLIVSLTLPHQVGGRVLILTQAAFDLESSNTNPFSISVILGPVSLM